MRLPDPIANTTTEAYLAYKAGVLNVGDLKPSLYDPCLHYDAWLAYWAGLVDTYPIHDVGKNLINVEPRTFDANGVTVTVGADNTITLDGTPSAKYNKSDQISISNTPFLPVGSTYTYSLKYISGSANGGSINLRIGATTTAYNTQFSQNMIMGNADASRTVTMAESGLVGVSGYVTKIQLAFGTTTTFSNYKIQLQLEEGSSATPYEPYTGTPEILTDEEALVAYLSGVTNTYPEEYSDPIDARITGYLRYLVSAKFGRPDYPVNNIEFYLSLMKPPIVTNDTPSSNIELDNTVEAAFVDVKMYGDTSQQTYTGKNLIGFPAKTISQDGLTITFEEDGTITIDGTRSGTTFTVYNASTLYNFPVGNITMTIIPISGSFSGLNIGYRAFGNNSQQWYQGYGANGSYVQETYNATQEKISEVAEVDFLLGSGTAVFDNFKFKLQVTAGTTHDTVYEPYVGGTPAPNPDYPQPVQTVTGRQVVKVEGKNLIQSVFRQGTHNNISDMRRITTQHGAYLSAGTTATISYNLDTTTYRTYMSGLTVDGVADSFYNSPWIDTESFTFTAPQSGYYFLTVAYKQETSESRILPTSGVISSLQLEKGSTATTYEPYQSQEYEVNLGKNLLNAPNFTAKTGGTTCTTTESNHFSCYGTVTGSWGFNIVDSRTNITTLPAGDYMLSLSKALSFPVSFQFRATSSGSSLVGVQTIDAGSVSKAFTLSEPASVFTFWSTASQGTQIDDVFTVQVEKGPTATSYAPYFEPIELCKIDDYQDYIYEDEDEWKIHKETGKYTFTGDEIENWGAYTGVANSSIITDYANSNNVPLTQFFKVASNVAGLNSVQDNTCCFNNSGPEVPRFYVKYSSLFTTADQFKTWLASHPLDVYYALATPTDTTITNAALVAQLDALAAAKSYNDKTYITVTAAGDNLPGLLKVEAGAE